MFNINSELAIVFPGQGSQAKGMLGALASRYSIVQETFQQASTALGFDLWEIVQNDPKDQLNQTEFTQPALLTAGVAVWRVWQTQGGAIPVIMAGHSLGEYTALVCAEAMDFEQAVRLVQFRGQCMQRAVPKGEGAMAAIMGLSDEEVQKLCQNTSQGEVLAPANYNSPGQIVIAGTALAVQRALSEAKTMGAKRALLLPVSVPSHCALMNKASEEFARALLDTPIKTPQIPVLHNVDVQMHSKEEDIRQALVCQLSNSVQWVQLVIKMVEKGVRKGVECGPGQVLTGLNCRISPDLTCFSVSDPESLAKALQG